MTGMGVERVRAAIRLPSVPPAGLSTLMPPHIQEAERRTESRARRTRWSLRILVLGGLAWLLTVAAAHAADRTGGPTGSFLGSVVGDTAPVSGLLSVAAQPLESDSPVHGRTGAPSDADHVRGEVAGLTRLTGGPAPTQQLPAIDEPRPVAVAPAVSPD